MGFEAEDPRIKLSGKAEAARQVDIKRRINKEELKSRRDQFIGGIKNELSKIIKESELILAFAENKLAILDNTIALMEVSDGLREKDIDKVESQEKALRREAEAASTKGDEKKLTEIASELARLGKKRENLISEKKVGEELLGVLKDARGAREDIPQQELNKALKKLEPLLDSGLSFEEIDRKARVILEDIGLNDEGRSGVILNKLEQLLSRLKAEDTSFEADRVEREKKLSRQEIIDQYGFSMKGGFRTFQLEAGEAVDKFGFRLANEVPSAFKDGMVDAMAAIINKTDDLKGALLGVANAFLQQTQRLFLTQAVDQLFAPRAFASGGKVGGGRVVPARVSAGEYLMSRDAVKSFGAGNMAAVNAGTYPVEGFASGGEVGRKSRDKYAKHLARFGTSFTDQKSSRFFSGLWEQVPKAQREVALANAAFEEQRSEDQAKKANKGQLTRSIFGTVLSAGLSYGIGKLGDLKFGKPSGAEGGGTPFMLSQGAIGPRRADNSFANGGMIQGPAGRDVIPAMLTEGEYVIKASSVKKYGRRFLDGINSGRKKYFNGGSVSGGSEGGAGSQQINFNMSFDVSSGQTESESSSGQKEQGGNEENLAQFAKNIKRMVQDEIRNEQRSGGLLSHNSGLRR